MNKNRLEGLSDAVFAIVMTLLTIEIVIPGSLHIETNEDLWSALVEIGPLFLAYFISFAVLATFWIAHNFFFHALVKNINRVLVFLNIVYLAFVGLIPFSTALLGEHMDLQLAVIVYGINVFLIGIMAIVAFVYAQASKEVDFAELDSRSHKQSKIRRYITPVLTLFGIISSFWSIPLALFFYAVPIVFNLIPGSLDFLEKLFGFQLS